MRVKTVFAILVSLAGALVTALGTGSDTGLGNLSLAQWLIAIGSVLASGGMVAFVSNIHGVAGGIAKAIVAFLSSGFASLVVALSDNVISQAEWLTAFAAAVVATGFVYQSPDTTP